MDGNPHLVNGAAMDVNLDAPQGWKHELHGAADHVHPIFGLNVAQMEGVQQDLQGQPPLDNANDVANAWDAWPAEEQAGDNSVDVQNNQQQEDAQ